MQMKYQVARRQTTFWDFADSEAITRVQFIGKKEFGFTQPAVASFSIEADHPLLADYLNGWARARLDGSGFLRKAARPEADVKQGESEAQTRRLSIRASPAHGESHRA